MIYIYIYNGSEWWLISVFIPIYPPEIVRWFPSERNLHFCGHVRACRVWFPEDHGMSEPEPWLVQAVALLGIHIEARVIWTCQAFTALFGGSIVSVSGGKIHFVHKSWGPWVGWMNGTLAQLWWSTLVLALWRSDICKWVEWVESLPQESHEGSQDEPFQISCSKPGLYVDVYEVVGIRGLKIFCSPQNSSWSHKK